MTAVEKLAFGLTCITDALNGFSLSEEHPLAETYREIGMHAHKFLQVLDEILERAPERTQDLQKLLADPNRVELPSMTSLR